MGVVCFPLTNSDSLLPLAVTLVRYSLSYCQFQPSAPASQHPIPRNLSFYRTTGKSAYQEVVSEAADRIVARNAHVVAFVPLGVERNGELWVVPTRACPSFKDATREEVDALSDVLRRVLGMLYLQRDDPDYNLLLRTLPVDRDGIPGCQLSEPPDQWYRWHLQIIPHGTGNWAGVKAYGDFTTISGMPQDAADALIQYDSIPLPQPVDRQSPITVVNSMPVLNRSSDNSIFCTFMGVSLVALLRAVLMKVY